MNILCKPKKEKSIESNKNQPINHKCQKCWNTKAKYVRKLDQEKIPKEYILDKSNVVTGLILYYLNQYPDNKRDISDKYNFIHFPKEFRLTKYDYYLCEECWSSEDHNCMPWNYWSSAD
jgi:hypothetical protein